ncbi:hypothetical protein CAPTEDRAFT_186492 [Capitella teleta]|uniref:Uncharacterized protein n=1 Tax=Capitella teleta TaxID=283909 RepID=R7VFM8_CAPTE|nr:hypothetical protein CAPTEDRAFT_186492 [Capitella teleta]|eukprot:ELU15101.1 hypothetical protein CAPTEDRAFT_186492 [Capitella teleta]
MNLLHIDMSSSGIANVLTELRVYYKALVDACLRAGLECIPHSTQRGGNSRSPVPMWSALVHPLRDQAMFWQALWKECGFPAIGEVALVRRSTRARYHRAIWHLKRNDELARFCAMGEDFIRGGHGDFLSEVRRMRGRGEAAPSCVPVLMVNLQTLESRLCSKPNITLSTTVLVLILGKCKNWLKKRTRMFSYTRTAPLISLRMKN